MRIVLLQGLLVMACACSSHITSEYPAAWGAIRSGLQDDCPDLAGRYMNRAEEAPSSEPASPFASIGMSYLLRMGSETNDVAGVVVLTQAGARQLSAALTLPSGEVRERVLEKDRDYVCEDATLVVRESGLATPEGALMQQTD